MAQEYGIISQVRGDAVYYQLSWSPLFKADRWAINAKVPAMAGIYEIYWMDDYKKLRMLSVGDTHYGGLRSELRRLTDPELMSDPKIVKILEERDIWIRYTLTNSAAIMADIVWFFRATYFPENPGVEHSGRYKKIFMQESEPDKLLWVE